MTREEIDRALGIEGKEAWMPDYDYGEIDEEENEELTRLLESLTEDDLQIARREIYHVPTRSVIYQETLLNERGPVIVPHTGSYKKFRR